MGSTASLASLCKAAFVCGVAHLVVFIVDGDIEVFLEAVSRRGLEVQIGRRLDSAPLDDQRPVLRVGSIQPPAYRPALRLAVDHHLLDGLVAQAIEGDVDIANAVFLGMDPGNLGDRGSRRRRQHVVLCGFLLLGLGLGFGFGLGGDRIGLLGRRSLDFNVLLGLYLLGRLSLFRDFRVLLGLGLLGLTCLGDFALLGRLSLLGRLVLFGCFVVLGRLFFLGAQPGHGEIHVGLPHEPCRHGTTLSLVADAFQLVQGELCLGLGGRGG